MLLNLALICLGWNIFIQKSICIVHKPIQADHIDSELQ